MTTVRSGHPGFDRGFVPIGFRSLKSGHKPEQGSILLPRREQKLKKEGLPREEGT